MKALSTDQVTRVARRARALGDPTRVRILQLLTRGEHPVRSIARAMDVAPSTISKHLQVLFNAELVDRRRAATEVIYSSSLRALQECLQALAGPTTRA